MSEEFAHYLAIGEEAVRDTAQKVTVAFMPTKEFKGTGYKPEKKPVQEFRGQDTRKGDTDVLLMGGMWENEYGFPLFSESAGITKGYDMLLYHFFCFVSSIQNATTGQYSNMYSIPGGYPTDAANLGTKAITVNPNFSFGANIRNLPAVGGIVKGLSFSQEPKDYLMLSAPMSGSFIETDEAEIGSPVWPAEALRYTYDMLKCYTGIITRVGSAPNYTDFTFGSATQFKPKNLKVSFEEDGRELDWELAGVKYPTKHKFGKVKVTVEFKMDWRKPASGFDTVDEFKAWLAGITYTNFCFHWDTATQAGSGDDHGMYIDIPRLDREGGDPSAQIEAGHAEIDLKYTGYLDASTTGYAGGILRKNTVDMS